MRFNLNIIAMTIFLSVSTCMQAMDELVTLAKCVVPIAVGYVWYEECKQGRQRRVIFDSQIKQGTFDGNSPKEIMRRAVPIMSTVGSIFCLVSGNLGAAVVTSAVSVGAILSNRSHIKNAEHAIMHRYDKSENDIERRHIVEIV